MKEPDYLLSPIEYLKGVGPIRATLLQKELNIFTFQDLLYHFPFRYEDRSKIYTIAYLQEHLDDSSYFQIVAKVLKLEVEGSQRSERLVATIADESGTAKLVWFKSVKFIKASLKIGQNYLIFGKPAIFGRSINIAHPEMELLGNNIPENKAGYQAIYSSTEKLKTRGLDSKGISTIVNNLLEQLPQNIPQEVFPQELLEKFKLVARNKAFNWIHQPKDLRFADAARYRLKHEELFFLQFEMASRKDYVRKNIKGYNFEIIGDNFNTFYKDILPFPLTNAQKRVVREIRHDMNNGSQMNRLLQGDVGSGKTVVALLSALIAKDNGFQSCIMAPTEILAKQHLITVTELLKGMNCRVELLTGSVKTKARRVIHEGLQSGEVDILVGTHALIEDEVKFKNLGLAIIDEQHRFGVEQRSKLWKKSALPPHVLVMTATPIPRTLAMTIYGDLEISVIDELPAGRKPIETKHYYYSSLLKLYGEIRKQIAEGRQVYVVYPLIESSESEMLKEVAYIQQGIEELGRSFPMPEYQISVVHGNMKADDKEYEMQRFVKHESQIMVATTVIEVGVNVPNASVMVIQNAERFGLAQLHQLRGRVGRGADQSYCYLLTKDRLNKDSFKRIKTMVETNDGFRIAEVDMELRGPGETSGTRQSGLSQLKLTNLTEDKYIIEQSKEIALAMIDKAEYAEYRQKAIAELRRKNFGNKDWSLVS